METSGTGSSLTRVERDELLTIWHDREVQLPGESFDPPESGWVSGVSRLITAPQEIRKVFSRSLGRTYAEGVRVDVQLEFTGESPMYWPLNGNG